MDEFFKPRQRKIGVLTLMMACAILGRWLRSQILMDELVVPEWDQWTSANGGLFWERTYSTDPRMPLPELTHEWSYSSCKLNPNYGVRHDHPDNKPQWRLVGFGFGEYVIGFTPKASSVTDDVFRARYWRLPYWSIVAPLTLLSAYLLLSEPRRPIPMRTSDPA